MTNILELWASRIEPPVLAWRYWKGTQSMLSPTRLETLSRDWDEQPLFGEPPDSIPLREAAEVCRRLDAVRAERDALRAALRECRPRICDLRVAELSDLETMQVCSDLLARIDALLEEKDPSLQPQTGAAPEE